MSMTLNEIATAIAVANHEKEMREFHERTHSIDNTFKKEKIRKGIMALFGLYQL